MARADPALCTSRVLMLWHLHGFSQGGLVPTGRTKQGILPMGDWQGWVQPASPGRQKLLGASPVCCLFGELEAQTVAFPLAEEITRHSQVSPCPASTVCHSSPSWRESPSTTCCSCLARLSSSGVCPEPSLGAVRVWVGMYGAPLGLSG